MLPLLKRPDLAKVINLNVDPHSFSIYTNTAADRAGIGRDSMAVNTQETSK